MIFTDNAEVIHQVCQRRESFPKKVSDYKLLEVFGPNILTTEGTTWRLHRKVTSASFNEKNAALVWAETIHQTQSLIDHWMGHDHDRDSSETLDAVNHDVMRLALHIISFAGFGLRLLWPAQKVSPDMDPDLARFSSRSPPPGHSMSFSESLELSLANIFLKLFIPRFLLKNLPFKATRVAYNATENFAQYIRELLDYKAKAIQSSEKPEPGLDIMGQLVHTKYASRGSKSGIKLTDEEIIGNAFIMLVAGHETTANAMHFTLLQLATHPAAQRALQRDVDRILGEKTLPLTWVYESNIGPLLGSALGACLDEVLRLYPSVVLIPKMVTPDRDQPIMIDGNKHILPKGASIGLIASAVHRNPRYWPNMNSNGKDTTDVTEFSLERWLRKPENTNRGSTFEKSDDENPNTREDWGGYKGPDSSPELFRPTRGSFVPFSDGPRSCLGRRLAQVEVMAALSVLFQKYSVELAVEEWVSDEEVSHMNTEQRKRVYEKAQQACESKMSRAYSLITLKMHGNMVPLRLVKRGHERFINEIEV